DGRTQRAASQTSLRTPKALDEGLRMPVMRGSLRRKSECAALVQGVELVFADSRRGAINDAPHGLDGIGLEDAHASSAVGARPGDWLLRPLRQLQLAAPERFRI